MEQVVIIYKTILAKIFSIILSSIVGFGFALVFQSMLIGIIIAVIVFIIVYWRFVGPMHYVTKEKLKYLVENHVFIDSQVNPYSKNIRSLNIDNEAWLIGLGMIDKFTDFYRTQNNSEGVVFYNTDLPYKPIFILPWSNVTDITGNTMLVKEKAKSEIDKEVIKEIKLKNGESILLPLNADYVMYWKLEKVNKDCHC